MSNGTKSLRLWLRRNLSALLRRSFPLAERLGVHVTPVSFYQPIPDARTLDPSLWTRRSELVGIDINEAKQLELLELLATRYRDEYSRFPSSPTGDPTEFHFANECFERVDAEVLHSMVRHLRPRRVIEIGCGYSTRITARALAKNAEEDGERATFTAIEPYPADWLAQILSEHDELIVDKVQSVPLQRFEALEPNDILFIDSSHVVKLGSDAQFEFLEVLPRLRPGVVIHFHDIFLPAEYPRRWVINEQRFWNEQYFLQAFLMFNKAFEVLWAGSYMHLTHADKLMEAFPAYDGSNALPGSFWIRRVG